MYERVEALKIHQDIKDTYLAATVVREDRTDYSLLRDGQGFVICELRSEALRRTISLCQARSTLLPYFSVRPDISLTASVEFHQGQLVFTKHGQYSLLSSKVSISVKPD